GIFVLHGSLGYEFVHQNSVKHQSSVLFSGRFDKYQVFRRSGFGGKPRLRSRLDALATFGGMASSGWSEGALGSPRASPSRVTRRAPASLAIAQPGYGEWPRREPQPASRSLSGLRRAAPR